MALLSCGRALFQSLLHRNSVFLVTSSHTRSLSASLQKLSFSTEQGPESPGLSAEQASSSDEKQSGPRGVNEPEKPDLQESQYAKDLAAELFWQLPPDSRKVGGLPWCLLGRRKLTGVYVKPQMSGRQYAKVRRAVLLSGREWPWEHFRRSKGGLPMRTPKGHQRHIRSAERQKIIEAKMANMDKIIADFREIKKITKTPTEKLLDHLLYTPKQVRQKLRGQRGRKA